MPEELMNVMEASSKYQATLPNDISGFINMTKMSGDWRQMLSLFSDFMAARAVLFTFMQRIHDEDNDESTVKRLCNEWIIKSDETFYKKYHFSELHMLLSPMSTQIISAKNRDELYNLINAIQHLFSQFFLWVDALLPWDELCCSYAEVMGDVAPDK